MPAIDWTQPIETTETPPRPVRVLFDKDGVAHALLIPDAYGDNKIWLLDGEEAYGNGRHIPLRNVAPPKPEPEFHDILEWESLLPGNHTDDCPVNQAEAAAWWQIELDRLRDERDSLKAEVERLVEDRAHQMDIRNETIDDLRAECAETRRHHGKALAEIARLRPVVDAAVAWSKNVYEGRTYYPDRNLMNAVSTYQSTPKKTAEEAVANVAAMMGPVKSCSNCRHDKYGICAVEGPFGFDDNNDCQDWEAKQ